jgi:hypothetical protein
MNNHRGLIMRIQLIDIYLDYWNNYLTPERYAECNGLRVHEAIKLIDLARSVFNTCHPES